MSWLAAGADVAVEAEVRRVAVEDFLPHQEAHTVLARALGRAQVVVSRLLRDLRAVVPLLPLDLQVAALLPHKAAPGPAAAQHAKVPAQVSAPGPEPAPLIALREAVRRLGN